MGCQQRARPPRAAVRYCQYALDGVLPARSLRLQLKRSSMNDTTIVAASVHGCDV